MMTRTPSTAAVLGLRARLFVMIVVASSAVLLAQGCQADNAVVGGRCAPRLTECSGRCVDTDTDPSNCGACSAICAPSVGCESGLCSASRDGSADGSDIPDGAADDSSLNRQPDACGLPPYDTPAACGACGVVCVSPTPRCARSPAGTFACVATCVAPLADCDGTCADLTNDPQNCGACGKFCPSNICLLGVCQGSTPGDIVVIGHDYSNGIAGSSQAKVLTNAAFIPHSNPLRILSYEQFAEPVAVANVKHLLQSAAAGRTLNVSATSAPTALASPALAQTYDVIVLYDQQAGDPAALATLGASWASALDAFAKAGGVIIALDGGAGQQGMPTLLTSAMLLAVPTHQPAPAGSVVGIFAPSDAVGSFVVGPYGSYDRTVTLQPSDPDGGNVTYVAKRIVAGVPTDPVVIHRVVP